MTREDIIRMAQGVSQNFAHRNYEDDLVEFFNMAYAAGAAAEREALKKYGQHRSNCAITLGGYQCTCGFNQQG